jgi:hypothetical protein
MYSIVFFLLYTSFENDDEAVGRDTHLGGSDYVKFLVYPKPSFKEFLQAHLPLLD